MNITVNMTKDEFLEYCKFTEFKSKQKTGIIEVNSSINNLMSELLKDGIWETDNKYDKLLKALNKSIDDYVKQQGGTR